MEKIIIGITGPDGTGKTTLAKKLGDFYHGHYHSIHHYLLEQYFLKGGDSKPTREAFAQFSNELRLTANDPAFAVRSTVETILRKKSASIDIIESFCIPKEMDFVREVCAGKAQCILIGINAYPQSRLDWMNRNDAFLPIAENNSAFLFSKEVRAWVEATEWQPNIDGCLEKVDHSFFNEGVGSVDKFFIEILGIVSEIITPP
jgi:hypothetical protein